MVSSEQRATCFLSLHQALNCTVENTLLYIVYMTSSKGNKWMPLPRTGTAYVLVLSVSSSWEMEFSREQKKFIFTHYCVSWCCYELNYESFGCYMKQDLGLVPVLSLILKHMIWNSKAYSVIGDIVSVVLLRLFAVKRVVCFLLILYSGDWVCWRIKYFL